MSAVSSVRTPGRIGDRDAAGECGRHVDMIDAVAEIGDELEIGPGFCQQIGVDLIRQGRHQNVRVRQRSGKLLRGELPVFQIEPGVEQLAHPGLDDVRQAAGHDDDGSLLHASLFPSGLPGSLLDIAPRPPAGPSRIPQNACAVAERFTVF